MPKQLKIVMIVIAVSYGIINRASGGAFVGGILFSLPVLLIIYGAYRLIQIIVQHELNRRNKVDALNSALDDIEQEMWNAEKAKHSKEP